MLIGSLGNYLHRRLSGERQHIRIVNKNCWTLVPTLSQWRHWLHSSHWWSNGLCVCLKSALLAQVPLVHWEQVYAEIVIWKCRPFNQRNLKIYDSNWVLHKKRGIWPNTRIKTSAALFNLAYIQFNCTEGISLQKGSERLVITGWTSLVTSAIYQNLLFFIFSISLLIHLGHNKH